MWEDQVRHIFRENTLQYVKQCEMQSHHGSGGLEITLKLKAEALDGSQALSSLCLPDIVFLKMNSNVPVSESRYKLFFSKS